MKLFLSAFLALAVAVMGLPSPGLTTIFTYTADLSGPAEEPPVPSPGTGFALVTYDDLAHILGIQTNFSDLVGTTTAAHIHAPTPTPLTGVAGVATQVPFFEGFPIGVTSGTYDHTFINIDTDASVWNPAFIAAQIPATPARAEVALAAALAEGKAYFNIHSTFRPGGEIRGFLVPAPATMLLFSTGLAGLAVIRLRRRKP
jgi:CHRD domain/PEP-CTERM motif